MNNLLSTMPGWIIKNIWVWGILSGILCLALLGGIIWGLTKDQQYQLPSTINIYTDTEGIYVLSNDDLAKYGLDLSLIKPEKLKLTLRGEEQSLWVLDGKDMRLFFYAKMSESIYQSDNVYRLTISDVESKLTTVVDGSYQELSAVDGINKMSYLETIRLEENSTYYPLAREGDHWLWHHLYAGTEYTYEFNTLGRSEGFGTIVVRLWSATETQVSPDHHVQILINGQHISDQSWDGIGWHEIRVEINSESLKDGSNTITLVSPGDTGSAIESAYVDWVTIEYWRPAIAQDGVFQFEAVDSSGSIANLDGIVTIVDITDHQLPAWVGRFKIDPQGFVLDSDNGHSYYIAEDDKLLKPDAISKALLEPDLLLESQGFTYLVLGDPTLLQKLQPLFELRREEGLSVSSIPIQLVYDQFGDGFVEPEAIRDFLSYAATHWNTSPHYVLLLGDATYDPRGYASDLPKYYIPTYLIDSNLGGETASDVLFSKLDDDNQPGIAIGRIPIRSLSQADAWLEKILKMERQRESSDWSRKILAIADGSESGFKLEAEYFLSGFDSPYSTELYKPTEGDTGRNTTIFNMFSENLLLVSYFGHGSLTMWGKDRLLTTEDIPRLPDNNIPLMVQMTCLTGLFTHPDIESLTEALLFKPGGGAISIIAPTSLTISFNQSAFSQPLAQAINMSTAERLGDQFLIAQRAVSETDPMASDVLNTFMLFGDPTLVLYP